MDRSLPLKMGLPMLAATWLVVACATTARAPSSPPVKKASFWDEKEQRCTQGFSVHLTFDDGPTEETTGKILDTLKEKGVHATFFVLGSRLDPFYIKQIRDSVS